MTESTWKVRIHVLRPVKQSKSSESWRGISRTDRPSYKSEIKDPLMILTTVACAELRIPLNHQQMNIPCQTTANVRGILRSPMKESGAYVLTCQIPENRRSHTEQKVWGQNFETAHWSQVHVDFARNQLLWTIWEWSGTSPSQGPAPGFFRSDGQCRSSLMAEWEKKLLWVPPCENNACSQSSKREKTKRKFWNSLFPQSKSGFVLLPWLKKLRNVQNLRLPKEENVRFYVLLCPQNLRWGHCTEYRLSSMRHWENDWLSVAVTLAKHKSHGSG